MELSHLNLQFWIYIGILDVRTQAAGGSLTFNEQNNIVTNKLAYY